MRTPYYIKKTTEKHEQMSECSSVKKLFRHLLWYPGDADSDILVEEMVAKSSNNAASSFLFIGQIFAYIALLVTLTIGLWGPLYWTLAILTLIALSKFALFSSAKKRLFREFYAEEPLLQNKLLAQRAIVAHERKTRALGLIRPEISVEEYDRQQEQLNSTEAKIIRGIAAIRKEEEEIFRQRERQERLETAQRLVESSESLGGDTESLVISGDSGLQGSNDLILGDVQRELGSQALIDEALSELS